MYPDLPSLNHFKTFDVAARFNSFKQAAEELHVTPTAVSHQIKALEEMLGTLLFKRKTRAVTLTKEGQLLAETTLRIFQQLAYTISEISDSKEMLTISTTSSFAAMWLVPNLDKFHQKHPGIDVSILTGEQLDDVARDRRIDIAIRYGEHNPNTAHSSKLMTESVGMYASPDYLAKISSISDAQLFETTWVNKELPSVSWQSLIDGQRNAKDSSEFLIRSFDQEHHVIQAALAGQGIALVSSLLVSSALNQQWLVPYANDLIDKDFNGLTYYLIVPPHSERNKNVKVFIEWLSQEIKR